MQLLPKKPTLSEKGERDYPILSGKEGGDGDSNNHDDIIVEDEAEAEEREDEGKEQDGRTSTSMVVDHGHIDTRDDDSMTGTRRFCAFFISVKEQLAKAFQHPRLTEEDKENLLKDMYDWNVHEKLKDAPDEVTGNREFMLRANTKTDRALKYASDALRSDKAFVMAAVKEKGWALEFASNDLRNDKAVVMTAVQENGYALEFASDEVRNDKAVVMVAVQENGRALQFASDEVRNDKAVVMTAVQKYGRALEYASDEVRNDKTVIMAAIQEKGYLLKFASNDLRSDKDVIIEAVKQRPTALKYALNGMNQDPDCLKAAGLFDEKYDTLTSNNAPRIVLSTKFSLGEKSSPYATKVALVMKAKSFFSSKVVYSPNAWDKNTCDKDWTNVDHLCRGTPETCEKYIFKDNVPVEHECCWRSSFRYQLTKAKETGGFMVQVAEFDYDVQDHVLGNGQQIETKLAEQVGVKVFRIYQEKRKIAPGFKFFGSELREGSISNLIDELVKSAEHWDKNGRDDMSVEEVRLEDIK